MLLSVACAVGLRVDWTEDDQRLGHVISVPPEVYVHGCVRDVDDGLAVSSSTPSPASLTLKPQRQPFLGNHSVLK